MITCLFQIASVLKPLCPLPYFRQPWYREPFLFQAGFVVLRQCLSMQSTLTWKMTVLVKAGLELEILLPQPCKCWDHSWTTYTWLPAIPNTFIMIIGILLFYQCIFSFFKLFCGCVVYACVYYVCRYACPCGCTWRSNVYIRCFPYLLSTYFLRQSLTDLKLAILNRMAGQGAPRVHLSVSPSAGLQWSAPPHLSFSGCWGSECRPSCLHSGHFTHCHSPVL